MNGPRTAPRLPLRGLTVVVTRPRVRADSLSSALAAAGATVLEFPTIRFAPPKDEGPLRRAVSRLADYDWVVFTSPTGVERVLALLEREGAGTAPLAVCSVGAIGPGTATALREAGVPVRVVPDRYRAEELLEAILEAVDRGGEGEGGGTPLRGLRFLLPRAAAARPILPDGLRRAGARVDVVAAYRTEQAKPDVERLRAALRRGEVDWVTFTAASTARHFVGLVGSELGGARVAAIGPVTAEAARRLGLSVSLTAREYTADGLVRALVERVEEEVGSRRAAP